LRGILFSAVSNLD